MLYSDFQAEIDEIRIEDTPARDGLQRLPQTKLYQQYVVVSERTRSVLEYSLALGFTR